MSDTLPDTPVLGRRYCPTCEPEADPTREILSTAYCTTHEPGCRGADDPPASWYRSGSAEAEGADCAMVARLIR